MFPQTETPLLVIAYAWVAVIIIQPKVVWYAKAGPIMARVWMNALKINMPLNIIYAAIQGKSVYNRKNSLSIKIPA